jgi:hypothetical protein
MRASYAEFITRLKRQLEGPLGKLPLKVRQDILEGRILDEPLNAFVVRVRANAVSVTQEHIDELKASGLDEDAIFDASVCAAFFAGWERWQAGMKALGKSGDAT